MLLVDEFKVKIYHGDAARKTWRVDGPHFLGHTISHLVLDPRGPKHLYIAMSGGGVHESLDGGATWRVLIDGMEVVQGYGLAASKPTFHDPHCLRLCASNPDRIYQQNHCGIYRIDRPSDTWVRVGKTMPKIYAVEAAVL